MNQELLDKIVTLAAKDPDRYQCRSGDDAALDRFYELFPLESLPALSLEQYCLGHGCMPENFSWWLERGLQKALGSYSPGTARGHLIYLQKGGDYYVHRYFAEFGPEKAIEIVRKALYAIASCSTLEEAKVVDDGEALAKRAGLDKKKYVVSGDARILRILIMYHPEWMLPINSIDHLRHFLTRLSDETDPELPTKSIELAIQLSTHLDEVRKATGLNITPWGFSNLLYSEDLGIVPPKRGSIYADDTTENDDNPSGKNDKPSDNELDPKPEFTGTNGKQSSIKNLILYGPPGTGKTYSTIDRALEVIDPELVDSTEGETDGRSKRKARFDELLQAKRIGFVTFHQSFSYEDFVEGLKASTDESLQVKYDVEDGIFKQMCIAAAASVGGNRKASAKKVDPVGRTIWKMSLGNTLGPDAAIYDECIENGYVLLGWGEGVDFTGSSTREAIKAKVEAEKPDGWESEYTVTACHAFVNTMKPGDMIIVSDGNHKFRAIGVVSGEYRILPLDEDRGLTYRQCRDVEWIRTYAPSLPSDQLMTVAFSQASIYRLKPPAINLDLVRSLLIEDGSGGADAPRPFVLIIDEINRGNISRVFGELITLIEDSKRTGNPEALSVKLPYSKDIFSVPANLYLIGTMNTADRSLAQLDIALRRRFVFEELMPDPTDSIGSADNRWHSRGPNAHGHEPPHRGSLRSGTHHRSHLLPFLKRRSEFGGNRADLLGEDSSSVGGVFLRRLGKDPTGSGRSPEAGGPCHDQAQILRWRS